MKEKESNQLVHTRIFGVFRAYIIITRVKDIFVHECSTGGYLPEERYFDRFTDLNLLTLLHEYLASEFATILSVERWHTVRLGVVALLERLKRGHQVVSTGNTVSNDSLCDAGGNGTLDDSSD